MFRLDLFTIVACLVILVAIGLAWRYTSRTNAENVLDRRKWLDQLPSIISTLGVLGTFLGITKGLLSFDTSDLDGSIPLLLDGLKTAFFTSLLGMAGSLLLNRAITFKLRDLGVDDGIDALAAAISGQGSNNAQLVEVVNTISVSIDQLRDDVEIIKGQMSQGGNDGGEIGRLTAVATTATSSIASLDNNVSELKGELKQIKDLVDELVEAQEGKQ